MCRHINEWGFVVQFTQDYAAGRLILERTWTPDQVMCMWFIPDTFIIDVFSVVLLFLSAVVRIHFVICDSALSEQSQYNRWMMCKACLTNTLQTYWNWPPLPVIFALVQQLQPVRLVTEWFLLLHGIMESAWNHPCMESAADWLETRVFKHFFQKTFEGFLFYVSDN